MWHTSPMNKRWITSGEVAALLNEPPRTVRHWGQTGKLRTIQNPGGQRRYDRHEIDAILAQREHPHAERG